MNEICSERQNGASSYSKDGVMFLLLHIAGAINGRLEAALNTVELSVPKFSALTMLIEASEPLALSELAAQMTCVRSNVTQLVDRLETDGLVVRVEDPKDRRSVRASVTALGRERQAAGARRVKEVQEEVAKAFSELSSESLERGLKKLS